MFMVCTLWYFRGDTSVTDTDMGTALNHVRPLPMLDGINLRERLLKHGDLMACRWE